VVVINAFIFTSYVIALINNQTDVAADILPVMQTVIVSSITSLAGFAAGSSSRDESAK
jgi:hypothetical protein